MRKRLIQGSMVTSEKKPQATCVHLEDIVPILAAFSLISHLRSLRFGATRCGAAIFGALTSMFWSRCGLRKIELHLSDDGAFDIVSELPSEEVFASFGRALSHLVELQNLDEIRARISVARLPVH